MSLERAYKNCGICHKIFTSSRLSPPNPSLYNDFDKVMNESIKALEEEKIFIMNQDSIIEGNRYACVKKALEQCKSCDYTTPNIQHVIDEMLKE